jgi:hypothetical protein
LLTEGIADSLPSDALEQKWIDSLVGFNQAGNPVPDPTLLPKQRYGLAFRPIQTMFVDRGTALKIAIDRSNSILTTRPFADLIDLGMNVEARFSGHILATAGTLLGHAITAKQAKLDKKLRMVDLQLKKMRLDQQAAKDAEKNDGSKLLDAEDGKGMILDRNELLKQILGKSDK